MIPILLTGCKKDKEYDPIILDGYEVVLESTEECEEILKNYYEYDGKKIQTSCIKEIRLITELTTQTLDYYLDNTDRNVDEVLDELTSKLTLKETARDGGTSVYQNDDMTIIRCNKINGSKNTIIAKGKINYSDALCE